MYYAGFVFMNDAVCESKCGVRQQLKNKKFIKKDHISLVYPSLI